MTLIQTTENDIDDLNEGHLISAQGKSLIVVSLMIMIMSMLIIIIDIIIIIITRPKPAYGRQGRAGSWGQDTDEVSTFLVFLTSHFAPVALSSDLNNLGP